MESKFLPVISTAIYEHIKSLNNPHELFDLLTQPLHEELYKRQSFDFLDELSEEQQLLLSYDYIQTQVLGGGFIQLIQNGYVGLLPPMPELLNKVGAPEMAKVIDDALKIYVAHHEILNKKTSIEEFALLYKEIKDFESIDKRFYDLNDSTINTILQYTVNNIEAFITLK